MLSCVQWAEPKRQRAVEKFRQARSSAGRLSNTRSALVGQCADHRAMTATERADHVEEQARAQRATTPSGGSVL